MRKKYLLFVAALAAFTFTSSFFAFAGSWQKNENGWWYQNDDNIASKSTWQWIDGNNDGIAENYYFNENGSLLTNTTTPDGYIVNQNGAKIKNGGVETQNVSQNTTQSLGSDVAKRAYETADVKTSDLQSLNVSSKIDITVTTAQKATNYSHNNEVRYKGLLATSSKVLIKSRLVKDGAETSQTMFYGEGFYCVDANGEKTKTSMDVSEAAAVAKKNIYLLVPKAAAKTDFQITTNGNEKNLTYKMASDNISSNLSSILGTVGLNADVSQAKIGEISGASVVDSEGFLKSDIVKTTIEVPIDGQMVTISLTWTYDCINPGFRNDFEIPYADGYTRV